MLVLFEIADNTSLFNLLLKQPENFVDRFSVPHLNTWHIYPFKMNTLLTGSGKLANNNINMQLSIYSEELFYHFVQKQKQSAC